MYLEMRYGPVCRTLYAPPPPAAARTHSPLSCLCHSYACLSLLMYIFAKISVALYAGGVVLQTFADINLQAAAVGLVCVSGLYTSIGGASAVIYTEVMQTAVLIIGGLCVLGLGLKAVGGWDSLRQQAAPEAFHMVQSGDGTWPPLGILFGLPYTSMYAAPAAQLQNRFSFSFTPHPPLLPSLPQATTGALIKSSCNAFFPPAASTTAKPAYCWRAS